MHSELLRLLARFLLWVLILLLPALIFTFTNRLRQQPEPREYAILFAILAAIGILLFLPAITVVASTALVALGVAWLTARWALAGVTYRHEITPRRMFPGDVAGVELQALNGKPLPLAWLEILDPIQHGLLRPGKTLDDHLHFSGGIETLDSPELVGSGLVNRTAVGPFQAVIRRYTVSALRRGIYGFGPATLTTGDPFGIFTRRVTLGERTEIIVYPRVYTPEEIGLPLRESLGEVSTRRTLFEDPSLLSGSRDYQPGDPLNRMNWKATARTGALQVRIYDPSTRAQLMFVLNLNTYHHAWQGIDLDRMEAGIEVAASLTLWALDHDFAVGMRSNGIVPEGENTPRLPISAHPRQSIQVLEYLARLAYSGRFSAEGVLLDEVHRLPASGSLIFITPIISPTLIKVLTSPRISGRVSVVYCGRIAAPLVRGVPIYLATPPREAVRAAS